MATGRTRSSAPAASRLSVPLVCAAVNGAAALALATVLAPGALLAPSAAGAAYVAEHLAAWRAGWGLWIAPALSLLAFFGWGAGRIGWAAAPPPAVAPAGGGGLFGRTGKGRGGEKG